MRCALLGFYAAVQDYLTLEYVTDSLSLNVVNKQALYAAHNPRRAHISSRILSPLAATQGRISHLFRTTDIRSIRVLWVVTPSSKVLITDVSKKPIASIFMCQTVLLPLGLPTQQTPSSHHQLYGSI
jgi:hypothetical protein